MDDLLTKVMGVIPQKYHTTLVLLAILAPYLTRAWHAMQTGGGILGMWNAIWFGTNAPKVTPAATGTTTTLTVTESPPTIK